MIFRHTSAEPGMWRGWFEDGHVVEVHWGREPLGMMLGETDNDSDEYRRQFWIGLGFVQVFVPLWRVSVSSDWTDDAKAWGFRSTQESTWLRWGNRSMFVNWPWNLHTLSYEQKMPDGAWETVFRHDREPFTEAHPYTYVLKSGEVQHRIATISRRRHVLTFIGTKRLKWPKWIKESIDVNFDGEVGERSGSWKGGCLGCGYDLRRGETMLEALRRMESERKF